MGTIKLVVRRYYAPVQIKVASIKEAVDMALSQLDAGESYPDYIEVDGQRVWSSTGIATIREELETLRLK